MSPHPVLVWVPTGAHRCLVVVVQVPTVPVCPQVPGGGSSEFASLQSPPTCLAINFLVVCFIAQHLSVGFQQAYFSGRTRCLRALLPVAQLSAGSGAWHLLPSGLLPPTSPARCAPCGCCALCPFCIGRWEIPSFIKLPSLPFIYVFILIDAEGRVTNRSSICLLSPQVATSARSGAAWNRELGFHPVCPVGVGPQALGYLWAFSGSSAGSWLWSQAARTLTQVPAGTWSGRARVV